MWFGTKDSSSNANLVNLVNSKIDINGTVNAVQNKKIGVICISSAARVSL